MIVTSEWRKRQDSANPLGTSEVVVRRWKTKFYWHFDCWIANAKQWLENHPYKNTTKRGGKPRPITPEVRKLRFNILVRRAKLATRLREAISAKEFETMSELLTKMEALKEEIRPLGGVPKSWENGENNAA